MNKFLKKLGFQVTLVAGDVVSIILAFIIAFLLRNLLSNFITVPVLISDDPIEYQLTSWWIIPLYLTVFTAQGLYSERRPFWQETKILIKSVTFTALLMYAIVSFGRLSPYVSRIIFLLHPSIVICILPLIRRFIKVFMFKVGLWSTPIVEIKVNTDYNLRHVWNANGFIGYKIVKSTKLSLNSRKKIDDLVAELKPFIKENNIETISIIISDMGDKKLSQLVEKLYFIAPQIIIIPELLSFDVMNADVYHLMYENLFVFDIKKGLVSNTNRFLKRLTDIIVSLFGIIVFLPVMAIIAALIYILDGRPILYNHERYGRDGKVFNFMKFRSMYKDGDSKRLPEYLKKHPEAEKEWKDYQKLRGYDPRLIKGIGWIIRKLDLDELPQLFNVLLGQMSLVGPRPYMIRERDLIGMYFDRILSVKPGITGLWQATGRNDFTFKQRLNIDTWYIQNWSMWLDFVIVLKTFKKALT